VPGDVEAVGKSESTHDMLELVLLPEATGAGGSWLSALSREPSAVVVVTPFSCRLTWWNLRVKRGVEDDWSMWCDTITFLRTPHGGEVVLPDDGGLLLDQVPDLPGLTWLLGEYRRC